MWSSTIPVACINAYAVVGPTNRKPRRFSSLAIAVDSGVTAGTWDRSAGRGRGGGANDHSNSPRSTSRSATARALAMVASIFGAVAHDPGVGHQPLDVAFGVAGDAFDVEPVERATEVLPLAQDDQPRQAALERLQADPFEQRRGVAQRLAPLGVVVVPVEDEIGWGQT